MISTSPEPLRRLVADIMQEHARAVAKFPGPNVNMTALVEETGELVDTLAGYLLGLTSAQGRLARVLLHFRPDDGGDSTWNQVRKEAVQVAVMALRVALEGDSTLATPDGRDALHAAPQDDVTAAVTGAAACTIRPPQPGECCPMCERPVTALSGGNDYGCECGAWRLKDGTWAAPPAPPPVRYPHDHTGKPVTPPDLIENRSHVAMDRFPRRGEVLTLRVMHWRQGVERMSGGDLYHLERLDEDTGKWRETNPPLDWSCRSMADLLANVTAWTKERGVEIVWHNTVYASETPFGARPHNTMDTAPPLDLPHGVAIRVDGELFTDKQIRAMVDQVRDFMRDGAKVKIADAVTAPDTVVVSIRTRDHQLTGTLRPHATHYRVEGEHLIADWTLTEFLQHTGLIPSEPAPADELAATPAQLEPGTVIIFGVTHERRFTATLEPGWEQYHLVVNDGELVTDGTLAQVLQTIGLLPSDELDEPAMKVTTPRGLCRIEGDKATSWKVEQFDGRAWVTIAGDVSLQIAQGVYNRRMKEQFPVDEMVKKAREEVVKLVRADFKQSIDEARGVLNTVREAILENGMDQTPAWEKAYNGIDALLSTPNFY